MMALIADVVDPQRQVVGEGTLHAHVVEHEVGGTAGEVWVSE